MRLYADMLAVKFLRVGIIAYFYNIVCVHHHLQIGLCDDLYPKWTQYDKYLLKSK